MWRRASLEATMHPRGPEPGPGPAPLLLEEEWEDEDSGDESMDESVASTHSSSYEPRRAYRKSRKALHRAEARQRVWADDRHAVRQRVLASDCAPHTSRHDRHASVEVLMHEREDMATPVASQRPPDGPLAAMPRGDAPKPASRGASPIAARHARHDAPQPDMRPHSASGQDLLGHPAPPPSAARHDAAPHPAPFGLRARMERVVYAIWVVLGILPPPNFDARHMHPPPPPPHRPARAAKARMASVWDYLCDEVLVNTSDCTQEMKWERVSNFMAMPVWIEKTVCFGFLICLNSLLYTFTILPMRFALAWYNWTYNTVSWLVRGEKHFLRVSHKCDMLKGLLVLQTCYILARVADASKMYHSVRGQDVVKLSVIFSVLEITDRLCCSFGQDVLDSLFSRRTLARRPNGTQPYRRMLGYYILALAYIVFHTFVLLYQLVTLNVAINSYDNALLTLLLSNQFVEIKTTVFKRFEKEILFQLTCADIVERFQLTMVLTAIGARNLIEVAGSQTLSGTSSLGPLPTSFEVYPYVNVLARTLNPVLTVLLSEMLVDWLKHAFITKNNHIRPAIYGRYIDVLCRDLLPSRAASMDGDHQRQSSFVDQSPVVTRRLGLAVLPLTCVLIRLGSQIAEMITQSRASDTCTFHAHAPHTWAQVAQAAVHGDAAVLLRGLERVMAHSAWMLVLLIVWLLVVVLKILLGIGLMHFATQRYARRHEREAEEARNARGRPPIGEMPHETSAHAQIKSMVDHPEDNATSIGLYGQQPPPGKPTKELSLLDVNRYTLAGSRLW